MFRLSDEWNSLSVESILDRAGVDYKLTSGASGTQINLRECPRCGNAHYKVYINQETGLGNCWTCPPGDNRFNKFSLTKSLLRTTSNAQVVNHLRALAKHQHWQPIVAQVVSTKSALVMPDSVPLPHNGQLPHYLVNRGIDAITARQFGLRYCHEGKFVYDWQGNPAEMNFSRRILFPIDDLMGRLVSFQGRDITGLAKKKYLFPPGHSTSGAVIYQAHRAIGVPTVIVGEGVFDVMALKIAFQDRPDIAAVGTFGMHLSCKRSENDQLGVLLKLREFGLREVVMCWDGSQEAIAAAVGAMATLHQVGFATRLMRLKQGLDPNEVTSETLLKCFHDAENYSVSLAARARLGAI